MPLVVVDGATLQCTGGDAPSLLTSIFAEGVDFSSACVQAATIFDSIPGLNVKPFGRCKYRSDKPCKPHTPLPWSTGLFSVFFSFASTLVQGDVLSCSHGGQIWIANAGQSTFLAEDRLPPPGELQFNISNGGGVIGELGTVAAVLGDGVSAVGKVLVDATPEAASLSGRILGGAAGIILGLLVSPTNTSDVLAPATIPLPIGGEHPYIPPKRKGRPRDEPVSARDVPGGFIDKGKRIWTQHGDHWDVQSKDGKSHTNIRPDGTVDHGDDNFNSQRNG